MTDPVAVPADLAEAGAGLWKRMTTEYEFAVEELAILECACRQADDVARLEESIRDNGLVTPGSMGQPRLAQAVTEVRQGRLAFARLLDGLRLPADADDVGQSGKSVRAQRAANARWDRVRRVEEGRRGTA